ncbi:Signal recognition particle receptor subunit alpha [Ascoidea rubescens DSM 1968]|uniref:Signal recognition particle receptor subunit alpha homolog n=1 Tax=Ascoidea rubescens DSM 1968 TaxID=1344418 RepID=A0A1D2VQN1_9ASCO|nr:P-loop containing nucleoside triphosphate hydrolase protein [Ascoidea rubescens DSM 1968]ODV63910.1 P-loop containing nucleoside triphosphate hydrolase protein [Ascoidea rubescens DSM 1968]
MLSKILIFTDSGFILYKYEHQKVPDSIINHFIQSNLISSINRSNINSFKDNAPENDVHDNHTHNNESVNKSNTDGSDNIDDANLIETYTYKSYNLKYIKQHSMSLIFLIVYPNIISINIKTLSNFFKILKNLFLSLIHQNFNNDKIDLYYLFNLKNNKDFLRFQNLIQLKIKEFNNSFEKNQSPINDSFESENTAITTTTTTTITTTTTTTNNINNNNNSDNNILKDKINEKINSLSEKSSKKKNKKISTKKNRIWGDNYNIDRDDPISKSLDFSNDKDSSISNSNSTSNINSISPNSNSNSNSNSNMDLNNLNQNSIKNNFKNSQGFKTFKEINDEIDEIISSNINSNSDISSKNNKSSSSSASASTYLKPFSFLQNYIGGKTITNADITKTIELLNNHLIKKNVSPEIASKITLNIQKNLLGSKTRTWESVELTAKRSLAEELQKILTPNTSIDLLHEIQLKLNSKQKNPYVISIVGVNGVGKSTNLSKLAFWLLQNNLRVLICACDTFRSGAVEQLKTHVNNLKNLSIDEKIKNQIELFEGGYGGSDLVAKIAKSAINYAKENQFDVILMDTAGRRHNDARLMAPLQSFARAANPDKIIMVGEALVGTDSVQQARNFNKAFGADRTLDFFIISKCDTVGDLIGSMVNMVYATGIPILFVGIGQTYTDLRTLSVDWAVRMLMS